MRIAGRRRRGLIRVAYMILSLPAHSPPIIPSRTGVSGRSPILLAWSGCALLLGMIFLMAGLASSALAEQNPAIGETRVARWKDDRTAAFLLMFDDSWPSHFQVAAPELAKRQMIATFYI